MRPDEDASRGRDVSRQPAHRRGAPRLRQAFGRALIFGFAAASAPLHRLRAQEFVPPQDQPAGGQGRLRVGLLGFGSRIGADFEGRNQVIVSPTIELADLFSPQVRLRPSAEVGLGDTVTTYVINAELMYRFTADREMAVPYVGFGGALYSQQRCSRAPDCPRVWAQFALGFELKFREHINWLLEYRGEDGLRRHRFFIGLTTRRGS